MKIAKSKLKKIIREELTDLQEMMTMETGEMSQRIKRISQILENYHGMSGEIYPAYKKIEEIINEGWVDSALGRRSAASAERMRGDAPAHAGQYVTDPNTGQRMYAKSGPKGNE